MQTDSSSQASQTATALVAQSVVAKTNQMREHLQREWQWPSPQGGFALFVLPSFGFTPEDHLPSTDQLRRGEAPLLASVGYALACNEAVRHTSALAQAWIEGVTRLSRKEAFPVDRESFVFRPLEFLGVALGVQHCPASPPTIGSWFRGLLSETERQGVFDDSWAALLGQVAARQIETKQQSIPLRDDYDLATLALWLWTQTQSVNTSENLVEPNSRLLRQFVEVVSMPGDYAAQVVLYSQIAPMVQESIERFSAPASEAQVTANPSRTPVSGVPQRVSHTQENMKGQIDFGIITVRDDEHRAVLKRFPVQFLYDGGERSYGINLTRLADGTLYTTAIIRCIDQGTGQGQDAARDLIADLDPHWLMLVGISGGVPESEWTLGDVLLCSRLQDFSVHAIIDNGKREFAMAGGPMHRGVQNFLTTLPMLESYLEGWNSRDSIGMSAPIVTLENDQFYGDEHWKDKVKKSLSLHFEQGISLRDPIYKVGTTASSDGLIKDSAVVQQWQQNARQLLNIEMELAGVYTASRRGDREYPILAVRGISDIVGYKRHPDWTAYACQSAASFARSVLELRPFPPVTKTSSLLK